MNKVLRFTASWCNPCKMLEKSLESVNTDIIIEKIDIDEQSDIAVKYNVRSVPTLIMINESGDEIKRTTGGRSSVKELEEWFSV